MKTGYVRNPPIGVPDQSQGRWYIKDPGARRAKRLASPEWTTEQIARILGMHNVVLGRFINGVGYPEVQTMKKFEYLFGWPCSEQIDLIPFLGATTGRQKKDLRYSMVLRQVIEDWKHNNPRTTPAAELQSLVPHKHRDPFGQNARKQKGDGDA